jgi:GWxTD domain-containing protein
MVRRLSWGILWIGLLPGLQAQVPSRALISAELPAAPEARIAWLAAADQYIRDVFTHQNRPLYPEAAQRYLLMLSMLDDSLTEAEARILAPHVQALKAIYPAAAGSKPDGLAMQRWWQQQDPRPATPQNERLEEHLERWAYAMRHYSIGGQLDDRGLIYVCYGPPSRKTSVRLDNARYRQQVLQREPTLSLSDFPENEFWVYSQIHKDLHFLFIRKGAEGYRIGNSEELLPRGLYQSPRRVMALLRTLEEIYRQLSIYHIDYGLLYDEVATYITAVESRIPRSELPSAVSFAQGMLAKVQQQDLTIRERQQLLRPPVYSNLFKAIDTLAIQLRLARFLNPDGATRTELYWSGPITTFRLSKTQQRQLERQGVDPTQATYVLESSLLRYDADYRAASPIKFYYRLPGSALAQQQGWLAPQRFVVEGLNDLHHLAFEVDQYIALADRFHPEQSILVKLFAVRFDSLEVLRSDPATLEMSDLLPLLYDPSAGDTLPGRPYPFSQLSPEVPLALYFEVYHLHLGPNGRTRYEVVYEVRRQEAGGLLRQDREVQTASRAIYEGTSRTARESIVLDLQPWKDSRLIEVVVRVRDWYSGQEVWRAINFELTI